MSTIGRIVLKLGRLQLCSALMGPKTRGLMQRASVKNRIELRRNVCIRGCWRYLLPSKAPQFIDLFSFIAQPLPMPESLVGLPSGTVSGKVVSYACMD